MSNQGDLFAAPSRARRGGGKADDTARELLRNRLERIAVERAAEVGRAGVTMDSVRAIAEHRGIMTGEEGGLVPSTGRMMAPRTLAWLGGVMPELARRGLLEPLRIEGRLQYGQSGGARAHGNKQVIWIATEKGLAVYRLMLVNPLATLGALEAST